MTGGFHPAGFAAVSAVPLAATMGRHTGAGKIPRNKTNYEAHEDTDSRRDSAVGSIRLLGCQRTANRLSNKAKEY